jgi:hypothetical protein
MSLKGYQCEHKFLYPKDLAIDRLMKLEHYEQSCHPTTKNESSTISIYHQNHDLQLNVIEVQL